MKVRGRFIPKRISFILRSSRKGTIASATLVASMVVTIGLSQAALFEHEISVKPPRSATSQAQPPSPSSIGASAILTYQALSDALSSAMPKTFDASGRQQVCADLNEQVEQTVHKLIGGDVGRFVGRVAKVVTQVVTVNQVRHVCQDVDYKVQVDRTGSVTVSPAVNKVHLSTTVSITGQAGFSGDVAKALALDKKNFRGGIEGSADISVDLDDHWCPHLGVTAGYRWTDKGQLEIIHNVWLGIEGQVGDKLKDQINSAVAKLQSSLTCDTVPKAVRDIWHAYSFAVPIPNLPGNSAYVNFTPTSAGLSGIGYGATDLGLAMTMGGTVEVTTSPASTTPAADLPPLTRIPATSDKIAIVLPVKIGYDDAAKAALAYFKGRSFEADTPAGHVKAVVTDLDVYPSAGRLALALGFSATTPHRIFDTKGNVYLLAEPVLDAGQQIVKLQNVSFTAALDNKLWSTLVTVFNGPIKALIEQKAVFDLKPRIADLRAKIQPQLVAAAAKEKIVLTLKQDFVGLRSINLEDKTLEVVAEFDGTADLVVRDILIPPIK